MKPRKFTGSTTTSHAELPVRPGGRQAGRQAAGLRPFARRDTDKIRRLTAKAERTYMKAALKSVGISQLCGDYQYAEPECEPSIRRPRQ